MIEEVPGHTLAHRFAHELVRRALYDRLAAGAARRASPADRRGARRARLRRLGRALGDIAHHFAAAAPIGGTDRAVEYSLLAAAAAMVALAFDEAAVALRTALELGIPGGTDRADALLDLGAVTYRAGRSVESQDAFLRRPRSPAAWATAAACRGLRSATRTPAGGWASTTAARSSCSRRRARRSRRATRSCVCACWRARPGAGFAGTARGERDGARRGDRHGPPGRRPPGLALDAQPLLLAARADALRDILDMLAEGRDIAQQLGDIEIGAEAIQWRIASLIAIGDLSAARVELAALLDMAGRMRQPFAMHVAEQYARRSRSATGACARRRRRPSGRGSGAASCGPRSVERLRHPDVRDPPRAGPARRAGAGCALAGGVRQGGGVAARAGGAHGGARDGPGGARRARPGPRRRPRHAAPGALAGVAHVPRRVCSIVGDAEMAGWSTPSSCRTPGAA